MIDHDQLFKKPLKEFFLEFVAAFLPAVHGYLDATSLEFLDKELFSELPLSQKRAADLVVKARFREQPTCFLLHVEPESRRRQKRGAFARRMFDYFALLTRDHHLPVYPVALLSYDKPLDLEVSSFKVEFPDKTVLEFRFTIIQLNRLKWRDYLRQDNPAAAALMAKMGFAPEERVEVKKECLRMIARLKYDPERTRFLAQFIDTYLRLTAEENQQFKAALQKLPRQEREATMELTTSWMEEGIEIGIQKGLQKGLQQGLQQGLQSERSLVMRLLTRRIGGLSQRAQASIARLSFEQLENLGEALLDFTEPRDLTQWLREHGTTKTNGKRAKR